MREKIYKIRRTGLITAAFIVIMLAVSGPIHAGNVITLSDAISAAEENNISLEIAKVSLDQVMRNQNNLLSTYMPSISASAGLGISGDLSNLEYNGFTWSIGASASFAFAGSMISDGAARAAAKESASLSYESTHNSIVDAVTQAYYQIAIIEATLRTAESTMLDAERSYASVRAQYESGTTDELTLNQSELAYNQAVYSVKSASDSLTSAKQAFRNMTGIEGDFTTEEIPEISPLSLPSAEDLYLEYAEGTIAMRSARNALQSAKITKDTAVYSTYIPTLTASVSYSGGGSSKTNNMTNNSLSGSVGISIPISSMLPGGSGDTSVKNAKDAVTTATLSLRDTEKTLLESIRSYVMSIEQSEANRELAEKTLENAERSYSLSEEAFEAGLISADTLSSARTSLLGAKMNLISLNANHVIACHELASALNITIEDLLERYSAGTK